LLADLGLPEACQKQPTVLGGINIMDGKVTHRAVADAHGIPCTPPAFT
jgi:alanine dehydrogenase